MLNVLNIQSTISENFMNPVSFMSSDREMGARGVFGAPGSGGYSWFDLKLKPGGTCFGFSSPLPFCVVLLVIPLGVILRPLRERLGELSILLFLDPSGKT